VTGPTVADLLRVRAALSVGAPPAEALSAATDDISRRVAAGLRLGETLERVARAGDLPREAVWLIRALALAERCGQGAVEAVDIALRAQRDATLDAQRLAAKTAQASGTARLLTALPLGAWVLLVVLDPTALRFLSTAIGVACAAATAVLSACGHWWSRRLIARAAGAAALADPLVPDRPPLDVRRAAAIGIPVAVVLWMAVPPLVAVGLGAGVGALGARPGRPARSSSSSVEIVHLLRMALVAQTGPAAALEHVAAVTADPVAAQLRGAAVRMRSGASVRDAFAGTGLDEIGAVLEITEQWGVSPAEPLRLLGDTVRATQRAAAETAAERVQLALVFPTTLLILPAFVLAIVPPLVWTALTG
jgi:tight adherence protein B